jgi:hypothetical protein
MITQKLTPAQFKSAVVKLNSEGLAISGDSGSFNHMGVSGTFNYDGETLSINLTSWPPFMEGHITKEIEAGLAQIASE